MNCWYRNWTSILGTPRTQCGLENQSRIFTRNSDPTLQFSTKKRWSTFKRREDSARFRKATTESAKTHQEYSHKKPISSFVFNGKPSKCLKWHRTRQKGTEGALNLCSWRGNWSLKIEEARTEGRRTHSEHWEPIWENPPRRLRKESDFGFSLVFTAVRRKIQGMTGRFKR